MVFRFVNQGEMSDEELRQFQIGRGLGTGEVAAKMHPVKDVMILTGRHVGAWMDHISIPGVNPSVFSTARWCFATRYLYH